MKKIELKERDNFTTRNSMTAVVHNGKIICFGGQDSEQQVLYNELYTIDTTTKDFTIKHVSYDDGEIAPAPRNSHTMVSDGKEFAYVFGGANQEGPRCDIFKLDLETLRFSNIKIKDETKKFPSLEMHTSHLYKESKLLILGGRGMFPGQTIEEAAFQDVIYSIDVKEGTYEIFGKLPADLASHQSALIDDQYLVMYGGTNGLRFFDSIVRYNIADKKWMLMTK